MSKIVEHPVHPGSEGAEPPVTEDVEAAIRERNATFEQDKQTATLWDKRDLLTRKPRR